MAASKTITVTTARGITSQVRVYDAGSAAGTAPIVYFHGAAGLLADEPMLEALATAGRTVYAPVWPGYGDEPGEELIEDMLDFTLHGWDIVTTLAAETGTVHAPVVVGHDMGAMIAAEMAAVAPSSVSHLVLISALGIWVDDSPIPDIFSMLPFEFPEKLFADATAGAALLTGGLDFEDPKAIETFQVNNSRRLGTAGKILFPIPNRRLSKRLYRLSTPTLLLWGAADKLTPADPYVGAWQAHLPHASVEVFDAAGHMVPVEVGPAAAARILAFLA